MAFRHHALGLLVFTKPDEARELIVQAFVRAGASRAKAASQLGCSRVTLWSWVKRLSMEKTLEQVETIARRDGWHYASGGRECPKTLDPF